MKNEEVKLKMFNVQCSILNYEISELIEF